MRTRSVKVGVGGSAGWRALAAVALLASLALAAGAGSQQKEKSSKKKEAYQYALLVGSVFDENGLSVRGTEVRVRQKEGKRHWEERTNSQGEFAVRLPVGSYVYIVETSAPGFTRDSREVAFTADERQDVVLRIHRERK